MPVHPLVRAMLLTGLVSGGCHFHAGAARKCAAPYGPYGEACAATALQHARDDRAEAERLHREMLDRLEQACACASARISGSRLSGCREVNVPELAPACFDLAMLRGRASYDGGQDALLAAVALAPDAVTHDWSAAKWLLRSFCKARYQRDGPACDVLRDIESATSRFRAAETASVAWLTDEVRVAMARQLLADKYEGELGERIAKASALVSVGDAPALLAYRAELEALPRREYVDALGALESAFRSRGLEDATLDQLKDFLKLRAGVAPFPGDRWPEVLDGVVLPAGDAAIARQHFNAVRALYAALSSSLPPATLARRSAELDASAIRFHDAASLGHAAAGRPTAARFHAGRVKSFGGTPSRPELAVPVAPEALPPLRVRVSNGRPCLGALPPLPPAPPAGTDAVEVTLQWRTCASKAHESFTTKQVIATETVEEYRGSSDVGFKTECNMGNCRVVSTGPSGRTRQEPVGRKVDVRRTQRVERWVFTLEARLEVSVQHGPAAVTFERDVSPPPQVIDGPRPDGDEVYVALGKSTAPLVEKLLEPGGQVHRTLAAREAVLLLAAARATRRRDDAASEELFALAAARASTSETWAYFKERYSLDPDAIGLHVPPKP